MHSNEPLVTRRGQAALLALLLTVLLGNGVPAFAAAEFGPAALTQTKASKSVVLTRSIRRESDDESDTANQPPLWLGASTKVEHDEVSLHPAGRRTAVRENLRAAGRSSPFRARAPPAA